MTSLRDSSMRRLETQSLIVYYPKHRRENARRVAERLEGCAGALRAETRIHNSHAGAKMKVVLPDLPLNNAFVLPMLAGDDTISVTPTSNTLDFVSELGMPPDPSFVGCHEIVHYVHMQQIKGFWGWYKSLFGPVVTPQIGLDAWFVEGLATYYESKLQPGTGRMAWPAWRGMFHAGFAGREVGGGDLSAFHRPFHWGNSYLVGSHFVEFIADRYGEDSLWKLIESQGGSFLFPMGVALRWKSATGKTLPALIDEFADYVREQYPDRARPAEQRIVRGAGSVARYAVAASGREALILASGDLPARIRIYDGGKLVRERGLTEILPPRKLAVANPILTSGLSFTGDGRYLYFVALDQGSLEQEARLMRYDVEADDLAVVLPRLNGAGGGVTADGASYYYAYADGDRRFLAVLDLATKRARVVRRVGPRGYYGPARPSPDGSKIASAVFDGNRFVLRVLRSSSGSTIAQVEVDGALHDPSWVDDDRLIALGEHDGKFQVHLYDLKTRTLARVSDAPYLAFQPRAFGDKVRFLNRDRWRWTLDEIPLRAIAEREAPPVERPLPDLPYAGPGGSTHAAAPSVAERAPAFARLHVVSDEPYSWLREVSDISIHTPVLLGVGTGDQATALLGFGVGGGDPLSTVRWRAMGLFDPRSNELSGAVHGSTSLLAPWEVTESLSSLSWSTAGPRETAPDLERRQDTFTAAIGRAFRTTRVELGGIWVRDQYGGYPPGVPEELTLGGPTASLSYVAAEATPFGGVRRALAVSTSAARYQYTTLDEPVTDIGGSLDIVAPIPVGKRHRLGLSLRGRRLYGIDRDAGFLEVGGTGALFANVWERSDQPDNPDFTDPAELSPQVEFHEPLRGFEDLSFATDRIAIGELTYSYPIILDAGFASTAYLLPSWFFRQIDLQLFASGATDSFAAFDTRRRFAAGASVSLAMAVWLVPVSVRYQLARRFTDDEALVHSVGIGFGL